jgi:hypothetical protein
LAREHSTHKEKYKRITKRNVQLLASVQGRDSWEDFSNSWSIPVWIKFHLSSYLYGNATYNQVTNADGENNAGFKCRHLQLQSLPSSRMQTQVHHKDEITKVMVTHSETDPKQLT